MSNIPKMGQLPTPVTSSGKSGDSGGIHIPKECRSKGVARRLAPEIQAGWWLSPTPQVGGAITKFCCFPMKNGGLTII